VEYFLIIPISSLHVIEKLKFEEGNLTQEKITSINRFKKWIESLVPDHLKKFCIIVTGFEYPKEPIMVDTI